MTDMNDGKKRGWVFYDAECPWCRRLAASWRRRIAPADFAWRPLQSPGAGARLGLSDAELLPEMRVLLADGRILSGVDAWSVLCRSVWWLWPLGFLMALPGLRALAAAAYRWVSRRRACCRRRCPADAGRLRSRRHSAFLEMP
jgi:predicted DCC family thiol-disulfide oxidoreductase YuxK